MEGTLTAKQQAYLYLAKLYALGEQMLGDKFQNRVIDAIVADELFIGQDDRHDTSIISIEAGRKDHAI